MNQSSEARGKPEQALRGGSWTVLSRVFVQLVQFAIFIIAARLMLPEEFGLFALGRGFRGDPQSTGDGGVAGIHPAMR